MPDSSGAFKGVSVPAEAWERIFGFPPTVEGDVNHQRGWCVGCSPDNCCGHGCVSTTPPAT